MLVCVCVWETPVHMFSFCVVFSALDSDIEDRLYIVDCGHTDSNVDVLHLIVKRSLCKLKTCSSALDDAYCTQNQQDPFQTSCFLLCCSDGLMRIYFGYFLFYFIGSLGQCSSIRMFFIYFIFKRCFFIYFFILLFFFIGLPDQDQDAFYFLLE